MKIIYIITILLALMLMQTPIAVMAQLSVFNGTDPSQVSAPLSIPMIDYLALLHKKSSQTKYYRLKNNHRIILIDFLSLNAQAQALNRVASLLEKKDLPGNRVITQYEMNRYFKNKHISPNTFYFGHNYRDEDLAKFFNLAKRDKVGLNSEERALLQSMLKLEVLKQQHGLYTAYNPPQAIVTLTQIAKKDSTAATAEFVNMTMRCTVLRHELSHGEFSTNPRYSEATKNFWRKTLSDEDRAKFRNFLSSRDYNDNNEELMANETQAYIMHSPNVGAFDPIKAGFTLKRIKELRKKFLAQANSSWIFQFFYLQPITSPSNLADINCSF